MQTPIKLGLIEDQLLFREGMKAILSSWPDIDVVFEAADGHDVVARLRAAPAVPDVVLVDLSLPPDGGKECGGLQVTQVLTEAFPALKILILSVHDDENFINQLIEHGAHGYLIKDSDPVEVYHAICSVHERGTYINARTLRALQQHKVRKPGLARHTVPITRREEEVLRLVCQQYTAEEIAERLFISTKTVNGHRNNLLQKTGSRNATGLVLYAVKNNIIKIT